MAILAPAFVALFFWTPPGWAPALGWAPRIRDHFLWLVPANGCCGPGPAGFRTTGLLLLMAMWGSYLFGLRTLAGISEPALRQRAWRVVMAVSVATQALLIFLPPLLSEDLYHYALFGRMVSHYGLNPAITPGDAIARDPLWAFANWTDMPTHYGPTFTWLSALVTTIAGGSVYGTAVAFKTMAVLFNIASTWAILRLARERGDGDGDGIGAAALWAWNPMVLIETASSGHNDAVMVGLALLGLLLLQRGRPAPGFLLLLASATVKFVTGSVLGLFLVHHVFQAPTARVGLRRAVGMGGLLLLVLVLLYLPFWGGRAGFGATIDLLSTGKSALTGSAAPLLARLSQAVFVVCFLVALVAAARAEWAALFVMASAVMLLFVLFVFSWHLPWYAMAGLAVTVAGPRTRANRMLLATALLMAYALSNPYAVLVSSAPSP
ncbi:MAG TPA: polyprenol phosphomannose-dependent alpha 1,6 mannosyltransferase MptB [Polyangia bacterium]|nr:polyprenol phosphomannose-dependent alpha 1,6 mannosyltransferase MptB [Polyangia bacterium]